MDLKGAAVKYSHILPIEILSMYKDYDNYIYINENDDNLQKFRIEVPEPPDWKEIEGFGLHYKKQKFEYEEYPNDLKALEKKIRAKILRNKKKTDSQFSIEKEIQFSIWDELETHSMKYNSIISWIRKQWAYRIYGKWIFIKGKPYYITPWHWFYLNYYKMNGVSKNDGRPDFRYRDFKWFYAQHYAATTTETVKYDEEGKIILLEDGTPSMIDIGVRTILGTNNLKGRRVGDSSKTKSIDIEIATALIEALNGMQADTEENARNLYEKLTKYSFLRLPFFFKPILPNFNMAGQIQMMDTNMIDGLNSVIDYRASTETKYDGSRLTFYHGDEIGKTIEAQIIKRHEIVKRTFCPGVEINGFMIYTSTAEEMDADVGKNFEDFTLKSMFEKRGIDGQTSTGLINIYFSIEESYAGFIDPWGFPIIEDTDDPELIECMEAVILNKNGKAMGVRNFLIAKKEEFIKNDDMVGLSSFQRKNPSSFKECFANASHNLFFNRTILVKRLSELKFKNNLRIGNFINIGDDNVHFIDDDNGPFKISMVMPDYNRSKIISINGIKRPKYTDLFVASADTYRISQTDSRRESKGSGAIRWKFDSTIDTPDKDISEYVTGKFVCTYTHRPNTLDDYCQDMLNMCIYYGALMYPEMNISTIQEYFIRHGYSGYLLHDIDIRTGKLKINAGWNTGGKSGIKEELFNIGADWVNIYAQNCNHPEILEEFLQIRSLQNMKDRDLFVSIVGCLKAEKSLHIDYKRKMDFSKISLDGWY
jgi:hypothetical protein